jgi:hypothetical protein
VLRKMNITPSIKCTAVYTFIYGSFWAVLVNSASTDSKLTLLVGLILVVLIIAIQYILLARKNISVSNNQLYIDDTLVSVSYQNKWLAFLWFDYIKYESSPWKQNGKGTLLRHMFSKEQWSALKGVNSEEVAAT